MFHRDVLHIFSATCLPQSENEMQKHGLIRKRRLKDQKFSLLNQKIVIRASLFLITLKYFDIFLEVSPEFWLFSVAPHQRLLLSRFQDGVCWDDARDIGQRINDCPPANQRAWIYDAVATHFGEIPNDRTELA
jgi:hypothetical protein